MVSDFSIKEITAFKEGMSYTSGMTFMDRKIFDRYLLESALCDLRKDLESRPSAKKYLSLTQLYIPKFSSADFKGAVHGCFYEDDGICYVDQEYIETSTLGGLKKTCLHEEAHRLAHILKADSGDIVHSEKWAKTMLDIGGELPYYYTRCSACGIERMVDTPLFYGGRCNCGKDISGDSIFMINSGRLIGAGQRNSAVQVIKRSITGAKRLIIIGNQKVYVNREKGSKFDEYI